MHTNMKTFTEKVYEITRKIPKGKTMTYGEVARRVGSPRAARAVGTVLSKNWDPKVPCHRVIGVDGRMRGYNRGLERKKEMLIEEGAI